MDRFYIYGNQYDYIFQQFKKKWKGRFYKKLHHSSGWSFPKSFQSEIEKNIQSISEKKLSNHSISDISLTDLSDTTTITNTSDKTTITDTTTTTNLSDKSTMTDTDKSTNQIIYDFDIPKDVFHYFSKFI